MLLPFEWAVLTYDEANLLADFIQKSTATPKGTTPNYAKMEKLGVLKIYHKLHEFIYAVKHHENLQHIDPNDIQMKEP